MKSREQAFQEPTIVHLFGWNSQDEEQAICGATRQGTPRLLWNYNWKNTSCTDCFIEFYDEYIANGHGEDAEAILTRAHEIRRMTPSEFFEYSISTYTPYVQKAIRDQVKRYLAHADAPEVLVQAKRSRKDIRDERDAAEVVAQNAAAERYAAQQEEAKQVAYARNLLKWALEGNLKKAIPQAQLALLTREERQRYFQYKEMVGAA